MIFSDFFRMISQIEEGIDETRNAGIGTLTPIDKKQARHFFGVPYLYKIGTCVQKAAPLAKPHNEAVIEWNPYHDIDWECNSQGHG